MAKKLDSKKDAILKELIGQDKKTLVKMAEGFTPPIELNSNWNARQIAFKIRARKLQDEAASNITEPEKQRPAQVPNPELEAALGGAPSNSEQPEVTDGRGGARPGAGRPQGSTAEKVSVKKALSITQPNETIKQLLMMFFGLWSAKMKLPELALTEKEANDLALPVTQLLEYYAPGQIPEIAWAWMSLSGVAFVIVEPRIEAIRKRNVKGVQSSEVKPDAAKT